MSAAPPSSSTIAAPTGELDRLRANRAGIGFMVAAMACFVCNDALVKYASQSMPAAQLIFVRGLMTIAWIVLVARATRSSIRPTAVFHRPVAMRSAFDAAATFAYLLSLFQMPIGNAIAINMASPIFITLLAVLMLRERVGTGQWAAMLVGFGGVVLLVRPTADGFNAFALLCLAGALLHALRDLTVRRIPADVSSATITLSTAFAVTAIAGLITAVQGWQPFGGFEFGLLAGASLFLAAAYHLLILATRKGELSAVAPFRYSGLLVALTIGWAVWGEMPDAIGWAGIGLLIAAGLYLLRRQQRH
ncbi:DMT family transporter [Zeimonas arvi]|uniref:DMT family transporter n=1 Tax=Zeimonas arvi TaxID=2498847 RepID=A0A5C8NSX7_9BURK|nr:DMT family transporter [Zeimonas arvi]TXL64131.1 DMT family transporter [Zeimonas arvi]